MDDEDEGDLYPEGPILEPDRRPFVERAAGFLMRNAFALFIAALVIGLALAWRFGPSAPDVSMANFEIIQPGMRETDINTLLKGSPTGRPRVPPPVDNYEIIDGVKVLQKVDWKEWSDGGGGRIIIGFVNGRVWHKSMEGAIKPR